MLAPCPDLLAFVSLHRVVQVRLSFLPMAVWAASYLGGLALAPPPNGALSASLVLCGCGLESSRPERQGLMALPEKPAREGPQGRIESHQREHGQLSLGG